MKKWLIALLTLLALSLSVAFAAEANDITEDCNWVTVLLWAGLQNWMRVVVLR